MKSPSDAPRFIVDNGDSEWKGIQHLQEWTASARAFDIATGFFEIGPFLRLDGHWQKLDCVRILMGEETTARTRQGLVDALRAKVCSKLDASVESEKETNDMLSGAEAVVQGLREGKIQCRIYTRRKFHAKAYITHSRASAGAAVALVGSSNFTLPGLTQNVELNVHIHRSGEVGQLQDWFEQHWLDAEDITPEVIRILERQIQEYSPFDVYAKALQELFEHHTPSDAEWEKCHSKMYQILDLYQKEGY